jgi:4'-phosphopantetheinyl transferase
MTNRRDADQHWHAFWPPPALGAEAVHVWRISLAPAGLAERMLGGHLSAADWQRAETFRTEPARREFVLGRGALRAILAPYVGCQPAELTLETGPHGKPGLAGPAHGTEVQFSIAHTQDLALVAVTRGRPIGVDVERLRPITDVQGIAERFFSDPEREALKPLAGTAEELNAFFRCWTRKEAYIKATGEGLGRGLDGFAVTLLAGDPARLAWCRDDPEAPARWSFASLAPAPGYEAALAVAGALASVRTWQFTPASRGPL